MDISCSSLLTFNTTSTSTVCPPNKTSSLCPLNRTSCSYSSSLFLQKKRRDRIVSCKYNGNGNVGWANLKGVRVGALAVAAALQLQLQLLCGSSSASEFDILNAAPPKEGETYVVDDAGVLNRVTKSDIKRLLSDLESRKGYHINFVTLRKLTSKADAYEFADSVLERWYPSVELGNNKGVVMLLTSQKEGAVTGGPAFLQAVGDQVLEGVVSQNLPVLATDEKYNEAMFSTAKRLVAVIDGLPDPGGPTFQDKKRESNFKTREETDEKRSQFVTVVGGLLVIAFVVPMAQYYAYVSKK
ncbi:hypothetical protein SUGI_0151030 [Cryptomeria japonica]|uniref:UPF0603 protein At1g54780, chloroplastic n=1 Tax=Cryptomeria japonica TaxID=3369 RepID=UPI002408C2DE|nr:UPF0603 protein At1g54780, chloroplastic [Cryptomeria japonica]GLJ11293.1 hypothetical protein SUGI_0151030 [Cryptomeria japonica]